MNNQNSKIIFPIIIIIIILFSYFSYNLFFNNSKQTVNVDSILKNTKLGSSLDLINKENFSFNEKVLNYFPNLQDFSKKITPSTIYGRDNPFLP